MVDIHCHILPNVDDGSSSLELSRQLLFNAYSEGIDAVCITPHFMRLNEYKIKRNELAKLFNEFEESVKDIPVDLYLGNELYIDSELDTLLLNKEICSLNDSRYVLVEFPFNNYKKEYDEYLYNISLQYKIIIAHPERYHYVQENCDFVNRWLKEGYSLQCNQGSLNYKQTKNVMFKLIEQGKVSFICSDAHNEYRPLTLTDAYNTISKKFNKETADVLFEENALRVLGDQELIKLKPVKKKLF